MKPIDYNKLNDVFNKFSGKEVLVDQGVGETRAGPQRVISVSAKDTVLAELEKALDDMGLRLQILWSNQARTQNVMPDRVNVNVYNYTNDGKFRIGPNYTIG
jgi:hypothetical protein